MNYNNNNWIEPNRNYLIEQSKMLQAIIARMANQSVEIKKFSITIWSGLMGFGFSTHESSLFGLSVVPVIFLGLLDVYYLHLEKRFRDNFDLLTRILGGFEAYTVDNLVSRTKGNFVALKRLGLQQRVIAYSKAMWSWANLPYFVVLGIAMWVWKTS